MFPIWISLNTVVRKDEKSYTIGHCVNGKLYRVGIPDSAYFTSSGFSAGAVSKEVWHLRLGHLNYQSVDKLATKDMAIGMHVKTNDSIGSSTCEACVLGKMAKLPFPKKSQHKTSQPLEIVHTDLIGPMQVPSHGGSLYALMFTDDFSRYITVYFLKHKSETLRKFQEYVSIMENYCGKKLKKLSIKTLRSDNGGEYTSNKFVKYCSEIGVSREFSTAYCPEQNGVAERFNRTIVESARSMLHHAKLPLQFWAEAVNTAVYLRNRCPTVSLEAKTPFECWFNRKPDISHLRTFGSICYVHIPDSQRQKLDAKSYKAIFVGYPLNTKGYKVFNLARGSFSRSRNVVFNENVFHEFGTAQPIREEIAEIGLPNELETDVVDTGDQEQDNPPLNLPAVIGEHVEPVVPLAEPNIVVAPTYEETFMRQVENLSLGEGRRRRRPPRLIEEECYFTESLLADVAEPKSVKEAFNGPHSAEWKKAMQTEFSSLMKNKTWDLVPRPKDHNIVGNRWVYKVKRGSTGAVERFKARLVAKGYSQTEGIDFTEVFSPVARFPTIRTLLAFANAHDLEVHHMDVTTAFLNGDLDCSIYMEQPEGFFDAENPDFVCKLKKGLYGLKQSARCWNSTLDSYLKSRGYVPNEADECVYFKTVKQDDGRVKFIILAVYVDDIIPISDDIALLEQEKHALCEKFDMVDNGEISYCLGLTIKRDRINRILTISQPQYIENILIRFGMQNCRPVTTPAEPGMKYSKFSDGDTMFDINTYQKAIGSLTYAAICTRPDISAAVGALSQYMASPTETHWTGVKRILRYLRGTTNYGLMYDGNGSNDLQGFSDADWAGDMDTRRSTSGYVFQLGNSTVSWCSRKQATVAKSSTEAEYVALSTATQEGIWLRRLLSGLKVDTRNATVIYEDNQGAIDLSKNPKHHDRTKHIDVCHHFVRERVASKEISVIYCPTNDMTADVMTKGLTTVKYQKFRQMLGVQDVANVF